MSGALDVASTEERVEIAAMRADLTSRGYRDIEHERLRIGQRVHHRNERYLEAYRDGTGVVVAVMEKSPSSWVAAGWGSRDIELIMLRDKPRLGTSRLSQLADYHVSVVEP